MFSFSFTFYVCKLIIFLLVLFISIKRDNADVNVKENSAGNGWRGVGNGQGGPNGSDQSNASNEAHIRNGLSLDGNRHGHDSPATGAKLIPNANDVNSMDERKFSQNLDNDRNTESNARILSRRRRYLIFPGGSSLQIGERSKIIFDSSLFESFARRLSLTWILFS